LKNQFIHIILYPFAVFYGLAVGIRNWLYDRGIFHSTAFSIPIIGVGNLSVGGTGKTPHTEFILSYVQDEWKTAFLSRGYKRKTKGFFLADEKSTYQTIGDEPYQIYRKFPKVIVAVDEKRVDGVMKLQKQFPDLQLVVMDDAFQHRQIKIGLTILLTDYFHLYTRDRLLPTGTLREQKSGSKRADIVIVTKCPPDLKPIDMRLVEKELNLTGRQQLFFSTYEYEEIVPVFPEKEEKKYSLQQINEKNGSLLIVTGIASPEKMIEYLRQFSNLIESLIFPDHHDFSKKDIEKMEQKFAQLPANEKIVIVTEKDAVRLLNNAFLSEFLKSKIYYLPIKVKILNHQEDSFIQKIKNYVRKNSKSN